MDDQNKDCKKYLGYRTHTKCLGCGKVMAFGGNCSTCGFNAPTYNYKICNRCENEIRMTEECHHCYDSPQPTSDRVMYICDRRKCKRKCYWPICMHTDDIQHAVHFQLTENGDMLEIEEPEWENF